MSRKKEVERWQHSFRLTSEDADQIKLHKHLVELGEVNMASDWIVMACLHLLNAVDEVSEANRTPIPFSGIDGLIHAGDSVKPEPHYEPVEETQRQMTPNEILRLRKAMAAQKNLPGQRKKE